MEILQDTIIQPLFRQGSDSERLNIVLKSGEPGFTTDTFRMYVGDGFSPGGVLVGNLFKGFSPDLTTLSPSTSGDMGYNTQNNTLYTIIEGDGTNLTDWRPLANLHTPIYVKYNGLSGASAEFSQNITTSSRLSAGHYRFTYGSLPTSNLIATTQIVGLDAVGYQSRTLTINNSSCDVVVLSSDGSKTDANITLLINY